MDIVLCVVLKYYWPIKDKLDSLEEFLYYHDYFSPNIAMCATFFQIYLTMPGIHFKERSDDEKAFIILYATVLFATGPLEEKGKSFE